MMLMLGGGPTVGCISPGCLEVDLQERVPNLLVGKYDFSIVLYYVTYKLNFHCTAHKKFTKIVIYHKILLNKLTHSSLSFIV
jgi:hypothetical protein